MSFILWIFLAVPHKKFTSGNSHISHLQTQTFYKSFNWLILWDFLLACLSVKLFFSLLDFLWQDLLEGLFLNWEVVLIEQILRSTKPPYLDKHLNIKEAQQSLWFLLIWLAQKYIFCLLRKLPNQCHQSYYSFVTIDQSSVFLMTQKKWTENRIHVFIRAE